MSDLSIALVPGYTFAAGEKVTAAKLNLAATPAITLSGTIGSASVADGSITLAKLAAGCLANTSTGRSKMADGFLSADAEGRAKMADLFVTAAKLGLNSVSIGNIVDGILTADAPGRAKMVNGFVTVAQLGDAAVETVKIKDTNVLPPKLKWPGTTLVGPNPNLDWSSGLAFAWTTAGNATYSLQNTISGQYIVFAITMGGNHSITFAAEVGITIKWKGGAQPAHTFTGQTDVYTFLRVGSVIFAKMDADYAA